MEQTADKPKLDLTKPFEAQCYYVKDQKTGAFGYFTVVPAVGLLQVACDFGIMHGTFADRWGSVGGDFKQFLTECARGYITQCLSSWIREFTLATNRKSENISQDRMHRLIQELWPLFIEKLKAEQEVPK